MKDIESYLQANKSRFESDLCDWLRIPSIGTDSAYDEQTRAAGLWLAEKFQSLGLQTEVIETVSHPLIFAQSPPVPNAPTILVYGHYDVQPPDPLDLWETPPFEPSVRDGNVFARGATDDKGQMITHLFGVETILKTRGQLPVQVKFLIEGEEESGGHGLKAFLNGEYDKKLPVQEKLAADIAVISDCSQFAPGQPAITYGLRGMLYCQIDLIGPATDLHSGKFGGSVRNPAIELSKLLDSIIDEGKIQIPGFYDDVLELTEQETEQLKRLDFSEEDYQQELGVESLFGEPGYSTLQRRWSRPTFDVHGLWSGYQGDGAKTVLPSKAGAKFSFRLVPNQDPQKIKEALTQWLELRCPSGIQMKLDLSHGSPAVVVPLESPFVEAASRAIEKGFGARPVFVRAGGGIPVVNALTKMPGVDTLLLGWGQEDDNLHSPNEKFSIADFHLGIKTCCYLLDEIAKVSN